ncbi:hypothetical protein Tco_0084385 [Tanacetum coccineum]
MTESYCPLHQSSVRVCVPYTHQHFKTPYDSSSKQLIINLAQYVSCVFLILLCPFPRRHIRIGVVSKSEVLEPMQKSLVNILESQVRKLMKLISPLQRIAVPATVAATWWWVAKAGGFIPTGCCLRHFNAPFGCHHCSGPTECTTYDMSNSDELRHTDNTTLVPPRFPETLPQVYHRRRPTLGLLILPYVSPFPPTIRRTARISIPPIEPNLAERARISARMIAEIDPTQREEALTETGQNSVLVPETALTVCTTRLRGQFYTILEDMDRFPNACLEELEAFMTLWDVKPRVEESSLETPSVDELITQLRQMCEDAEDCASNAQEEA